VHCLGMCGGIVGALTLGLERQSGGGTRSAWPFLLAYNTGRVLSYAAAGAVMGGLGAVVLKLAPAQVMQTFLLLAAGVFMVLLGLYLGGWWRILVRVERLGSGLWRRLEPLGRGLLPVRTPLQAFVIGVLWGWIPCGLVYTMLIWAVASGGAPQGALILLVFGAGTVPNLLAMGLFAGSLAPHLRRPAVRWVAGAVLVLFGVTTLWRAL
jgi:sulfite exporter TauE/SafE